MTANIAKRTIGIVACSAEGAALCYRTICSRAPVLLGKHAHPDIVLHSISLADYVEALEAGDLRGVANIMLKSAEHLKAAGADFLICPDNTIHSAMAYVRPNSPLPWLHIAEVLASEASRRGFQRPCILGTQWLVESDVYPDALARFGIDFLLPENNERLKISEIIMDELVNDIQRAESVSYFQALIEKMKARGCDSAILGCTEIPIIINDDNSELPTLDSTRLLADAALHHAVLARSGERSHG
ncbi:MAG: amino acid racemase [Pseudomonadota bacterium]